MDSDRKANGGCQGLGQGEGGAVYKSRNIISHRDIFIISELSSAPLSLPPLSHNTPREEGRRQRPRCLCSKEVSRQGLRPWARSAVRAGASPDLGASHSLGHSYNSLQKKKKSAKMKGKHMEAKGALALQGNKFQSLLLFPLARRKPLDRPYGVRSGCGAPHAGPSYFPCPQVLFACLLFPLGWKTSW